MAADDSVASGSFKVTVLSDGSKQELTRGHFVPPTKLVDEAESSPVKAPTEGEKGQAGVSEEVYRVQHEGLPEEANEDPSDAAAHKGRDGDAAANAANEAST
eukprot:1639010-Pleurochrysis_carterae.AAC.1